MKIEYQSFEDSSFMRALSYLHDLGVYRNMVYRDFNGSRGVRGGDRMNETSMQLSGKGKFWSSAIGERMNESR